MPWAPLNPIGIGAGAAAGNEINQQQGMQQGAFLAQLLMHAQQVQQQREATQAYRDAMIADRNQRTQQGGEIAAENQRIRQENNDREGLQATPSLTPITPERYQRAQAVGAGSLFEPIPNQEPQPPQALAANGSGPTGETQAQDMVGSVANSPMPSATGFRRIPTDAYLAKQATDRLRQVTEARQADQGQQRLDQGQQRIDVNLGGQRADDARLDRSYQYNSSQLATLRKSFGDRAERLGRLQDSINQGNAAADALIGPELLSVAAGGQGSGLRMNEAEISRIVGGRSNWETLRAKLQMWNTDPKAARSLTPEQMTQLQGLANAITKRNSDALAVLDKAGDDLVNAGSVEEHRRILNEARKALTQTQTPTGQNNQQQNDIRVGGTFNGKKILKIEPVGQP